MTTHPDTARYALEPDLEVTPPKTAAAGLPAVAVSLGMAVRQMGSPARHANLLRLNQTDGFDCMSCAWPDPEPGTGTPPSSARTAPRRSPGRATARPRRAGVLRRALGRRPGRGAPTTGSSSRAGSTQPMVRRDGRHPLRADLAGTRRSRWSPSTCTALDSPDEAVFYTSGRASATRPRSSTSCFARAFGTNNLPDCSNMCHESTGGRRWPRRSASARARCRCEDLHDGRPDRRSPGRTRAPTTRGCSSALEIAKRDGAQDHRDQPAARGRAAAASTTRRSRAGWSGTGTELADRYLQIRSDGDLALCQAIGQPAAGRDAGRHGSTTSSSTQHTVGFDAWAAARRASSTGTTVLAATGLTLGRDRGGGRRCSRALEADRALLGDGHHPAPQRGRHDPGVRQRRCCSRA